MLRQSPTTRAFLLVALVVSVALAVAACGGDEEKPRLPAVHQGNTLTLAVKEIKEKDVIYYQEGDGVVYAVRPSDSGHKLAVILVQAYNGTANSVAMSVDEKGYILLDKPAKEYTSINPFGDRRRLEPNPPTNEGLTQPLLWGTFEIPKGFSIEGWTLFEIPKSVKPYQLRWHALETIFVPFYPIK